MRGLHLARGRQQDRLLGYDVDRESGEFADGGLEEDDPHDRRHARRGEDPPARPQSRNGSCWRVPFPTSSVEAYITQTTLARRFKIGNIVLIAPDLDIDVAPTKMWKTGSDPDLPYGKAPNPGVVVPSPEFHITVYVSPNDKALATVGLAVGKRCAPRPHRREHAASGGHCTGPLTRVLRCDPGHGGEVLHLSPLLRFRPTSQLGPDRAAALRIEAQRAWPAAGRGREAVLARADGCAIRTPRNEELIHSRSSALLSHLPFAGPPVLGRERLLLRRVV